MKSLILILLIINFFHRIASFGTIANNDNNIFKKLYNSKTNDDTTFTITTATTSNNSNEVLSDSVIKTILQGKIAVVPNFVSKDVVRQLRNDAKDLHQNGYFTTDALAVYGAEQVTKFDPTKDRTVLKLKEWKRNDIGNPFVRHDLFGKNIMSKLRTELSCKLNRPKLDTGLSTEKYGIGSTEISYTRFGPGAYLKRHVDEHHEELKGRRGWEKPTRRSISWLIYLNDDDWDGDLHGGHLRCFLRKDNCVDNVRLGSQLNGDLQIGWLRATKEDPIERPIFMDGRRPGNDGHCALYTTASTSRDENENDNKTFKYISKNFHPDPILYLSGGDFFVQRLLIDNPTLSSRFHFIERPNNSALDKYFAKKSIIETEPYNDEMAINIPPLGGTLVLFDSVSLPHEVLSSHGRERWAASGWFHEDQQDPPHYYNS